MCDVRSPAACMRLCLIKFHSWKPKPDLPSSSEQNVSVIYSIPTSRPLKEKRCSFFYVSFDLSDVSLDFISLFVLLNFSILSLDYKGSQYCISTRLIPFYQVQNLMLNHQELHRKQLVFNFPGKVLTVNSSRVGVVHVPPKPSRLWML